MPRCLVALGSNVGDREQTLAGAMAMLRQVPEIAALKHSRWRETSPVGGPGGQGPFLNGAASFETSLAAAALLEVLLGIERALGRERRERWEARAIDLDLLLYGDHLIDTPTLVVPHPRMAFRRFVLEGAAEIAPDMVHPTIGWTVGQLSKHLQTALPYFALLGLPESGKTALATSLARHFAGRAIVHPAAEIVPGGPEDQPSQAYKRQIQFLGHAASLLAARAWPERRITAVSDFYFDECLAYAESELSADDADAVRRAWLAAQTEVVSPKLLVVLDVPPSRHKAAGNLADARQRLRASFARLAARRGIGPVLYAGESDRKRQFDEISAAIAAMQ